MSEFGRDLVRLVGDLVAVHQDGASLWVALAEAGIPQVAAHGEGDLSDLVACVRQVGRALPMVPLVEHAVAEWAVGPDLPGTTSVALIDRALGKAPVEVDLGDVAWPDGLSGLLVIGADRAVLVDPTGGQAETAVDFAGRKIARVSIAAATPLRTSPLPVEDIRARLRTVLAAELLGTAEAAVDLTRDYVASRVQFGQPLIKIPAVAHGLGRLRSDVAAAAAALTRAVAQIPDADRIAAAAVAAAAGRVASGAHQLHGAVGVTQEYPLHLLTRRLWADRDRWTGEQTYLREIGRRVVEASDDFLFDELSAPAWWETHPGG